LLVRKYTAYTHLDRTNEIANHKFVLQNFTGVRVPIGIVLATDCDDRGSLIAISYYECVRRRVGKLSIHGESGSQGRKRRGNDKVAREDDSRVCMENFNLDGAQITRLNL